MFTNHFDLQSCCKCLTNLMILCRTHCTNSSHVFLLPLVCLLLSIFPPFHSVLLFFSANLLRCVECLLLAPINSCSNSTPLHLRTRFIFCRTFASSFLPLTISITCFVKNLSEVFNVCVFQCLLSLFLYCKFSHVSPSSISLYNVFFC